MAKIVADNDIVYKGVWFRLLRELLEQVPAGSEETLILGAAKYVVGNRLQKQLKKVVADAPAAIQYFNEMMGELALIEPTADEQALAADLENAAVREGLELDSGESQLCAVLVTRGLEQLVTGDKRAIAALEALAKNRGEVAAVAGRVLCLEQLFIRLLGAADPAAIRGAVCSNAHADRALATCFSCHSPEVPSSQWKAGLDSYVEALRAAAPTMLSRTIP